MGKFLTGIVLNQPDRESLQVLKLEDTLDVYQQVIGCRHIDVYPANVMGRNFLVILDKDGVYDNDEISGVILSPEIGNFRDIIVGPLIIMSGRLANDSWDGLNKEETEYLMRYIVSAQDVFPIADKERKLLLCY